MHHGIIDIHCHALYGVDDGAENMEESIKMFHMAVDQQVCALVLTPHYQVEMFDYPKDTVVKRYEELRAQAEKMNLGIYLGCEYYADSEMGKNLGAGRCMTMNGTQQVLTEFSVYAEYGQIRTYVQMLMRDGYLPVIAHAERYGCLVKNLDNLIELSRMGAQIQLNADSVLGKEGFMIKRFCRRVLQYRLADYIASDSHGSIRRPSHMQACAAYVEKKYGSEYAEKLFYSNAAEHFQLL
jgi:protein-tyrosine phosphatase